MVGSIKKWDMEQGYIYIYTHTQIMILLER